MRPISSYLPLSLAFCTVVGCTTGGGGGDRDSGGPRPDGASGSECPPGEVVRYEQCVPLPAACAEDNDCTNDRCCADNECIPYGIGPCGDFDEECNLDGSEPPPFAPALECEWLGREPGGVSAMSTPVVGDFDLDNDPDTLRPSIVLSTQNQLLVVLDGATCSQQWSRRDAGYGNSSTPAIADLDGDGRPELIAAGTDLRAFRVDPELSIFRELWINDELSAGMRAGSVSVHDLNDDGSPEVIVGTRVFSADGELQIAGTNAQLPTSPLLADVDADGRTELIYDQVYEADLAEGAWVVDEAWAGPGGGDYFAVADFGDQGDGEEAAEIVRVDNGAMSDPSMLSILRLTGDVFFGPFQTSEGARTAGPPTIADFDGDGEPEVGVADALAYTVFDTECDADPIPEGCAERGVRWRQPSQDLSSGRTGSSVFDFEGDGAAEVVYADECYLRIYDGNDGNVKFSVARSSGTWLEYPVIADVDGDRNSEIVVTFNSLRHEASCPEEYDPLFFGDSCLDRPCASPLHECVEGICRAPAAGQRGLRVYGDLADLWVNSRPIWNQYSYHVTHITDDGRVPRTSEWPRNWSVAGLNNFRQNVQGDFLEGESPAPDLTIRPASGWRCDGGANQVFEVRVCNRGAETVGPGVAVSFLVDGESICERSQTVGFLPPGVCESVECEWDAAPSEPVDVRVVADDSSAAFTPSYRECREDNNLAVFPQDSCDLD